MSYTVTNLTNQNQSFGNVNLAPHQQIVVPYLDQVAAAAALAAGVVSITPALAAAPVTLTDNSGGTPTTTIAAINVATPADFAAVAAQLVIIRNAIASLAAAGNNNSAGLGNAIAQLNAGIENP